MAEILVYNKAHWMDDSTAYIKAHLRIDSDDKLNTAQKIKSKEILTDKYNTRNQQGDVIEIRPDGFWTVDRLGFGSEHFALLVLPGVPVEDIQYLLEPDEQDGVLKKKCRYSIDWKPRVLDMDKKLKDLKLSDITIKDKRNGD